MPSKAEIWLHLHPITFAYHPLSQSVSSNCSTNFLQFSNFSFGSNFSFMNGNLYEFIHGSIRSVISTTTPSSPIFWYSPNFGIDGTVWSKHEPNQVVLGNGYFVYSDGSIIWASVHSNQEKFNLIIWLRNWKNWSYSLWRAFPSDHTLIESFGETYCESVVLNDSPAESLVVSIKPWWVNFVGLHFPANAWSLTRVLFFSLP